MQNLPDEGVLLKSGDYTCINDDESVISDCDNISNNDHIIISDSDYSSTNASMTREHTENKSHCSLPAERSKLSQSEIASLDDFSCSLCNKTYQHRQSLQRHISKSHPEEKKIHVAI